MHILLSKIDNIIGAFEKWVIVALLSLSFIFGFMQVVSRYFFNYGFTWIPEVLIFALIIVTVAGASSGAKTGVHVSVDVIVKLLPIRVQLFSHFFANFVGIVLCLFLSYLGLRFALYYKEIGQVSIILEIPIWAVISYFPVCFFFMAFHYMALLWETFRKNAPVLEKHHI
jgi:C4-dicarboxylate transporter DctQ subunit